MWTHIPTPSSLLVATLDQSLSLLGHDEVLASGDPKDGRPADGWPAVDGSQDAILAGVLVADGRHAQHSKPRRDCRTELPRVLPDAASEHDRVESRHGSGCGRDAGGGP